MTRTAPPPVDSAYTRRATTYVVTHYLLVYLGYYGVVSTLVVALTAASFNTAQIAALVVVFSLTNKIANIPLAPWLDRMPAAQSVLLGCSMAGVGFVSLRFSSGMTMTVLSLAFAGAGISINALATKQLAAAASDRIANHSTLFSLISMGVNIAAAVAAPVALFFVDREMHDQVLLAIAAIYVAAGVVAFLRRDTVRTRRTTKATSFRRYLDVLVEPGMRRFLLINSFYWIIYGQLFTVLAVYVSSTLGSPRLLGWLYTGNALLVVFLQLFVTRFANRVAKGRALTIVVLSYGLFAVSFLTPQLVPGYLGAVLFVVLFTIAEMMFVPSGDVLIVGLINPESRAVGYSLFAISTALGEALGSGAGVAAYRYLVDQGRGGWFWVAAAGLAVVFAVITQSLRGTSLAGK
ncbi:MFS transporter [Umezawaea sp.]|uniref:MFS transporter n=1 Tax=Umezawaea sp. TaxID=1955258 RepID=UPI002ED16EB8